MTNKEIIDGIARRMRDTKYKKFPTGQIAYIDFVQKAQYELGALLRNELLLAIETSADVTLTAGVGIAPLSSIFKEAEGITKFRDNSTGHFGEIVDRADMKTIENKLLGGTRRTPRAYILEKEIIVYPANITSIKLYYLDFPTAIDYNTSSPDLNASLHFLIQDLGTAFAKMEDGDIEESMNILTVIYRRIENL